MSLLLAYHDAKRAAISSDDRMVSPERVPLESRTPKFIVLGDLILGCVGRHDLSLKIWNGTERLRAEKGLGLAQLAEILPHVSRRAFSTRKPLPILDGDKLDVLLLGWDERESRIRCFVWRSDNDFATTETTRDEAARIVCLGGFDLSSERSLHDLTERAARAKHKGLPWVSAELRNTIAELSKRHPDIIGQPSYFAAIDRNGTVNLPAAFPLPASERIPTSAAAALYAGRFFVGSIVTPVSGGPDTQGNNDGGAAAQTGMMTTIPFVLPSGIGTNPSTFGSGTVSGDGGVNAIDGDLATYTEFTVTGNGNNSNTAILYLQCGGSLKRAFTSLKLKISVRMVTNNLSPAGTAKQGVYYGFNGIGNATTAVKEYSAGETNASQTEYSVDLPKETNLLTLFLKVQDACGAVSGPPTSGQAVLRFYEAWVEAVE